MKIIGLLDSPFVRRVCVTAALYGITIERRDLSVYGDEAELREFNSLLTAPVAILRDGEILVDSAAIIDYLDEQFGRDEALIATSGSERRRTLQGVAIAQFACEKIGQLWREVSYRPTSLTFEPIVDRMGQQISRAFAQLEDNYLESHRLAPTHAEVFIAIAFRFAQHYVPALVPADKHPRIVSTSAMLEATEPFRTFSFPEQV